jgi:hypothetical protein
MGTEAGRSLSAAICRRRRGAVADRSKGHDHDIWTEPWAAEYKGSRDEGYPMHEFASHDVDEAREPGTARHGRRVKVGARG